MQEYRPVLIVGAGPTGLTAALELARLGIPVRLVDQYSAPSDTSRALAVQSRTVELLHQRGIADAMVELGNKGFYASLFDGATPLGKIDLHALDSRFNSSCCWPSPRPSASCANACNRPAWTWSARRRWWRSASSMAKRRACA